MSAVTKRTVTVTRHEYIVASPAAGSDLAGAVNAALADMPPERRQYDDAYQVEARDGVIVVWWPGGEVVAGGA